SLPLCHEPEEALKVPRCQIDIGLLPPGYERILHAGICVMFLLNEHPEILERHASRQQTQSPRVFQHGYDCCLTARDAPWKLDVSEAARTVLASERHHPAHQVFLTVSSQCAIPCLQELRLGLPKPEAGRIREFPVR